MKKILLSMLILFIAAPLFVIADGISVQKITLEQKGEFESIATVEKNDFAVPTMIDVPIEFNEDARSFAIVTDSTGVIVPSTVVTKSQKSVLTFGANDSFANSNANNMVDGKYDTFTEFPFVEKGGQYEIIDANVVLQNSVNGGNELMYSEEKYVGGEEQVEGRGQNVVVIDVNANRTFRADHLNVQFDKNVERPTRIRVVVVKKDGSEQILLPEQFFGQDTMNFPEANSDHYRITLHYIKPLRINEITFFEKDVPQTNQSFVRFIAQPQMAYDIYYNTDVYVKTQPMESPNFSSNKNVVTVQTQSTKNNPLYKKADTDEDGIVDSADNCVGVANVDQLDRNKNGKGDACEDFDRDGVINVNDNCSKTANRTQKDDDLDGIGDACDEEESRFMEKNPWIPYVVLVIVFAIVATLIIKTLKQK